MNATVFTQTNVVELEGKHFLVTTTTEIRPLPKMDDLDQLAPVAQLRASLVEAISDGPPAA
jgi:hypothetical protein